MIQKESIKSITYVGMDVVNKVSIERIFYAVCEHLKVEQVAVKGLTRVREVADARHIFCNLAYHSDSQHTLKEIGNYINKDHASVLHGKNKINNLLTTDREMFKTVEAIRLKLGRFSNEDVNSKAITQANVGWYNSKERREALNLYCENHDVVSKSKLVTK